MYGAILIRSPEYSSLQSCHIVLAPHMLMLFCIDIVPIIWVKEKLQSTFFFFLHLYSNFHTKYVLRYLFIFQEREKADTWQKWHIKFQSWKITRCNTLLKKRNFPMFPLLNDNHRLNNSRKSNSTKSPYKAAIYIMGRIYVIIT